nr:hypothetical protein [Modestobacter sp. DSM 44400]
MTRRTELRRRTGQTGTVSPGRTAGGAHEERRAAMSKRGRKRRARKKSGANHGKRPNA